MAKHASQFLRLVNDAKSRITECTIADLKPRLDAGEKFFLVDVREESEYAAGHLPGATHLGKGVIEQAVPEAATEIVLYCGGGYRSALAADNLQKMGYTNVISMDGGIRAWREAGYSIEG